MIKILINSLHKFSSYSSTPNLDSVMDIQIVSQTYQHYSRKCFVGKTRLYSFKHISGTAPVRHHIKSKVQKIPIMKIDTESIFVKIIVRLPSLIADQTSNVNSHILSTITVRKCYMNILYN